MDDVLPLDSLRVAEDGVVAESHSTSQDFCMNGTTVTKLFDSYQFTKCTHSFLCIANVLLNVSNVQI